MIKFPYVIANWKMYKTVREGTDYVQTLLPLIEGYHAHVLLAVPFTSIRPISQFVRGSSLTIGAQTMHQEREGAFTGEISALMLKEAGASFVLLGHSERRTLFQETDALIHNKLVRALQMDFQPVLCIGESFEEKESNQTEEVLQRQLLQALGQIPLESLNKLLIAYEPVWAIGTGAVPSPQKVAETHCFLRSLLKKNVARQGILECPILYGGSVKPENVASFMATQQVDGFLVGGASLDPKSFASIVVQSCDQPSS